MSDDLRDRIAAALVSYGMDYAQEVSDLLAPVMRVYVAEQLRAAANDAVRERVTLPRTVVWLRDRADRILS